MPRVRQPKSLKNCCLKRIALSFDSYWLKDFDANFGETARLLYVIGPFEYFTCELTQALIDHFVQEKCLKRRHFQFLLQSSVTTLDLSWAIPAANHDSVIKTLIARCPKLRSANLCGLNCVSPRALTDLVTQISGLTSLNLKGTKCNDQVLSAVARSCKELRDLDVSGTACGDNGVRYLYGGHCTGSDVGCTKLAKLQIFATPVTTEGATCVLENLPNLRFLGYDDICSVVAVIQFGHDSELNTNSVCDSSCGRKYNLTNITSHGIRVFPIPENWIEVGILSCPKAVDVGLYCGATDASIGHLKDLPDLRILGLGNTDWDAPHLTFSHGVLPLLQAIGGHLLELTLADINNIDVLSIGEHCPHLWKFSLQSTQDTVNLPTHTVTVASKERMFTELRELRILFSFDGDIEESLDGGVLELMLCNARQLHSLHVNRVAALTSRLLERVLAHNPLGHLMALRLHRCDNVSGDTVARLLAGNSCLECLETVVLHECRDITYSDYQGYMRTASQQGWHGIKISWN